MARSSARRTGMAAPPASSRRPRRTQLDAARKTPRVVVEQVDDDLGDVLRREFPVAAAGSAGEAGGDRPWHHVADADVVVPHLLHERLAELVEPGFRRAV